MINPNIQKLLLSSNKEDNNLGIQLLKAKNDEELLNMLLEYFGYSHDLKDFNVHAFVRSKSWEYLGMRYKYVSDQPEIIWGLRYGIIIKKPENEHTR